MAIECEICQKDAERRDHGNGPLYMRGQKENQDNKKNMHLIVNLAMLCAQSGQGHMPHVIDMGHCQLCPTHLWLLVHEIG